MRSAGALGMFAALLAALLCVAVARNAAAQDSGFFSGKTITVVVGYSAGGGYDQYARMLARHLGRHIPGNPTIVVRNMPGAASLTAVRYLSTTAPKDGTVITVFDPGLVLESRTSPDKFNVNFSDYQWLGSMSRDWRDLHHSAPTTCRPAPPTSTISQRQRSRRTCWTFSMRPDNWVGHSLSPGKFRASACRS